MPFNAGGEVLVLRLLCFHTGARITLLGSLRLHLAVFITLLFAETYQNLLECAIKNLADKLHCLFLRDTDFLRNVTGFSAKFFRIQWNRILTYLSFYIRQSNLTHFCFIQRYS
ncbi:MAG: hypothetical protein UW17_C0044G0003 [Candidatus Nomurabacteria bacterium GW2011_GWD1_44_10]|nr:MAG: hypothetical protein UW17_C0044G0003 [Candidatus Nomurabacteria bacterium GW2011_GWD1_44_10]